MENLTMCERKCRRISVVSSVRHRPNALESTFIHLSINKSIRIKLFAVATTEIAYVEKYLKSKNEKVIIWKFTHVVSRKSHTLESIHSNNKANGRHTEQKKNTQRMPAATGCSSYKSNEKRTEHFHIHIYASNKMSRKCVACECMHSAAWWTPGCTVHIFIEKWFAICFSFSSCSPSPPPPIVNFSEPFLFVFCSWHIELYINLSQKWELMHLNKRKCVRRDQKDYPLYVAICYCGQAQPLSVIMITIIELNWSFRNRCHPLFSAVYCHLLMRPTLSSCTLVLRQKSERAHAVNCVFAVSSAGCVFVSFVCVFLCVRGSLCFDLHHNTFTLIWNVYKHGL